MIENHSDRRAPLRRGITHVEAAHGALFLSSPHAGGITGRVPAVDAGYFIMGA
ncbi:MAG: SDR family oxidoreductase [Acidobacteriota bacterium]|nr:MAG: SDR family oxidoreductase [Acidobacteriota bacterium]